MVVKQVQSASRVLATFEALAQHQPAGVSALARALGDDKSAVQRALLTLADAGWIARTGPDLGQWKLTPRVAAFAAVAEQRVNLRAIAPCWKTCATSWARRCCWPCSATGGC